MLDRLRQAFTGKRDSIRFTGNYKSWAEAEKKSTGYANPEILEKTRAALLKVKAGEAAFERDSVTFDVMRHEVQLLAGLSRAAAADEGRLSVLDFGGSLGTTYFQYRSVLSAVKDLRWSVIDQPAHVACGQKDFANEQLRFYRTIDECLRVEKPGLLLLSSVLQYLPEPYEFLERIVGHEIPYVIIERTPFTPDGGHRLTIQHVPAWIYRATLPAWFLSEPAIRECFGKRYELTCEYSTGDYPSARTVEARFKGFQFQLKSRALPREA